MPVDLEFAYTLSAQAKLVLNFNLEEVPDVARRISPHAGPVKRAIQTASKSPASRSASASASRLAARREPAAGAGLEAPHGVEARAVLTIRF
jgi:hypothetical protein